MRTTRDLTTTLAPRDFIRDDKRPRFASGALATFITISVCAAIYMYPRTLAQPRARSRGRPRAKATASLRPAERQLRSRIPRKPVPLSTSLRRELQKRVAARALSAEPWRTAPPLEELLGIAGRGLLLRRLLDLPSELARAEGVQGQAGRAAHLDTHRVGHQLRVLYLLLNRRAAPAPVGGVAARGCPPARLPAPRHPPPRAAVPSRLARAASSAQRGERAASGSRRRLAGASCCRRRVAPLDAREPPLRTARAAADSRR